jgi:putative ABC transport system permease protein
VVVEVALAVVLLSGAALLGKSFLRLPNVDPGFQTDRVVTAVINLPRAHYPTTGQAARFYEALIGRASALPGVKAAALTDVLPLAGDDNRSGVQVEGFEPKPGERVRMHPRLVSPDYLQTMGIPLIEGRSFVQADASAPRHVAIVSQTASRRYWPDRSPVGRRFAFTVENAPWIEVIGVAGPVHNRSLNADSTPDVYLPFRANPFAYPPTNTTLVLKTESDDLALASGIRAAVSYLDRSVAVSNIRAMEAYVADSVAPQQFNLILLATFALLAVILAAAGLYGTLSYLVSQRTAEIAIRVALGAVPRDVLQIIIGRGFVLAAVGVLLGAATTLVVTRAMSSLLFAVEPGDPIVLSSISLFLMVVALLASYFPAHRATKLDPLAALRSD